MIKLKNQKGITLVVLSLAIVIMLIISSILIYQSTRGLHHNELRNMYNDVAVLRDKIAVYYAKHGTLPIVEYTYPNTESLQGINENDNNNYYIIDLKLLEGLTLNYGRGYDLIETEQKYSADIYVVNEQSHNVYYMLGIKYDNEIYYTTPEEYTKVEVYSYDKPYIPEGFSYKEGMVATGFVIEQNGTGNQFVWIPVPDYEAFVANDDYRLDNYSDTAYGYVKSEQHYNNMLASVKKYGGFYIGRYEAGGTTQRQGTSLLTVAPQIEENQYPYNYVTREQAQTIAEKLVISGRTSSLMYGIQWDAILRFIATNSTATSITVAQGGSAAWGNYATTAFSISDMSKKKYTTDGKNWITVANSKPTDSNWLLTTGASTRNRILNIYDLAGNVAEYTLEKYANTTNSVYRGGSCADNGASMPASARENRDMTNVVYNIGFRVTIW